MKKVACLALGLALSGALPACGRDAAFSQPLTPLPPVALARSVVYVETTSHTAHIVDVSGDGSLALRSAPLGDGPSLVQVRAGAGHDEALVLTHGRRSATGVTPQNAGLTVVSGAPGTAPRTYDLGESPFNALAQDADGRRAVAFFVAGAGFDRLLFNPNEIAVLALDDAPAPETAMPSNPVRRTVRSFGGVPTGALFADVMVGGSPRHLVIVLSASYVTLLDLDHPLRREVTVPLTLSTTVRDVRPTQVVVDAEDATIYLRADATDDVYAIHLDPVAPVAPEDDDFAPSLTQLAVGAAPADMLLYHEADGPRLLVLTKTRHTLAVIDARSSAVQSIELGAVADHLLAFDAPDPGGADAKPRALAYPDDGLSARVTFIDLVGLQSRGTRNLDVRSAARAVRGALPVPSSTYVLLPHASGPGEPGLSVLDLVARTAAPIEAEISLTGAQFGSGSRRMWVAPGGNRVGFLDLVTLAPGEVRLDADAVDVLPLTGLGKVAVVQRSPYGMLTVVDEADPGRGTAHEIDGILLDGLLARGGL